MASLGSWVPRFWAGYSCCVEHRWQQPGTTQVHTPKTGLVQELAEGPYREGDPGRAWPAEAAITGNGSDQPCDHPSATHLPSYGQALDLGASGVWHKHIFLEPRPASCRKQFTGPQLSPAASGSALGSWGWGAGGDSSLHLAAENVVERGG